MTKRLSLVLASITLAIACSYFLTGKLIQRTYYENIAKINSQPNIKVNLLNYKRGIIHSTAKLSIELGSDNPNDMQVLAVEQIITHGPIIFANTPKGHRVKLLAGQIKTSFREPWDKRLEDYTTNKQPLAITTLVNFSSEATTWIRLSAIDQTTPTKFHFAMEPINGVIEHNLNFSYYHGFITLPELDMSNPEWQFKIKNLALNLDANSKDFQYASSNTMTTESLTYVKNEKDVIKLNGITAKLAFTSKNSNLGLDLEASVVDSLIADQHFQQDTIKLQADNINRATLSHLPRITALGPKGTVDLLQQLTVASTNITLELPKHFTEALISYVSFEIYKTSYLGKFDVRPAQAVLEDITGSIHKLMQGAVQQQLFLDKGTYYALNFNGTTPQAQSQS